MADLTCDHFAFTVTGGSPCLQPRSLAARGSVVSGGGVVDMDALLTVTEAAALARVSKQLVNWWRTSGRIEASKRNDVWHYRLGDVLKVESDTRRKPQSHRSAA